jgi:hypothetical protein
MPHFHSNFVLLHISCKSVYYEKGHTWNWTFVPDTAKDSKVFQFSVQKQCTNSDGCKLLEILKRTLTDTSSVLLCFALCNNWLIKGQNICYIWMVWPPFWSSAGGSASTGLFLHWVGWQERQEAVFRGLEPYIGNSIPFPWDQWSIFTQGPPLIGFLRIMKQIAEVEEKSFTSSCNICP